MLVRKLAFVLVRVLAIYLFIQALKSLSQLSNLIYFPFPDESDHRMWLQVIAISMGPFVVYVATGVILWVYTQHLSRLIAPIEEGFMEDMAGISLKSLQSAAFSVVGLFLLVKGIPALFLIVPNLVFLNEEYSLMSYKFKLEAIFGITQIAAELLIGTCLLFGGKRLAGWVNKINL